MFQGKADQSNIEMCDAFNVFATFTMLLELELRSKRNRAKITGCGVNALSTHQSGAVCRLIRRSGFNAASERPGRLKERVIAHLKSIDILHFRFGFAQKPSASLT